MKFNIDDYKGKYVMHCKTEEEAKDFCHYLYSIGKDWGSDDSYITNARWDIFGEDTVYFFNTDAVSDIKGARNHNYTILEWSDFMNHTFTKADLKTGDVIKRRNGDVEIVNCELGMLILQNGGWNDFDDINEDLTYKNDAKYDIVAVRRPIDKADCSFIAFNHKWGTLVYDREAEEVEEMTLAQVCKLLGKNIKIIQ